LHLDSYIVLGDDNGQGLLTLNTSLLSNNTQLGGEIFWRPADVDAVSMRVSARITGDTGAVAGIFTYHNDTQESDIEILTRDGDSSVHLTNQPTLDANDQPVADSTFNRSMPWFKTVDEFSVYRLDWFPNLGVSAWYVDGALLKSSEVNVPFEASTIMIDMWSNGGSWSGDMPVWGEAQIEIQWIELAFNASTLEPLGKPKNGVVCQIDPLGDNDGSQRDDDPNGYTEPNSSEDGSSDDSDGAAVAFKAGLGSSLLVSATTILVLMFI
jgi:beta-glucanase (GH16 family)